MSGVFSGISGASMSKARDSYAAWVRMVNAKGGIQGHPVKLFIADNHASASEDLANAKKFVEEDGAIALVNWFPAAGEDDSLEQYARQKNVPIVGGASLEPVWLKSPVMFPAYGAVNAHEYGWAKAMADAGKKKAAAFYCSEGAVCHEKEQRWAKHARSLGIDVVYEAGVSLAQPDFTSQCVEARNNGADAIVTVLDGASANRVAQACDRQGYHPLLVNPNPYPSVPSYADGMVGVMASFPWFVQSGSPALDEYGAAIRKYVTNDQNTYTSLGWINGKLLEKALSHGVSPKPTSQNVFNGLWAMKNETLGGLTPPITFNKGGPPTEIRCVYKALARSGKWTAPAGAKPTLCMPG